MNSIAYRIKLPNHVYVPKNKSLTFILDISDCGIVAVSFSVIRSVISDISGMIAPRPRTVKFHILGPIDFESLK